MKALVTDERMLESHREGEDKRKKGTRCSKEKFEDLVVPVTPQCVMLAFVGQEQNGPDMIFKKKDSVRKEHNRCEGMKMDKEMKSLNCLALMNSTAIALPTGAIMSALAVKTRFDLLEEW